MDQRWQTLILNKVRDIAGVKFIVGMTAMILIYRTENITIATLIFLTAMVAIFGRFGLEFALIYFLKGKTDKIHHECKDPKAEKEGESS